MSDLDLPSAVDLLAKQTDSINNLWTVYVVATFAAGGFNGLDGLTGKVKAYVALALTVGFLAFAIGHFSMIYTELAARRVLGGQIAAALSSMPVPARFRDALSSYTKVADIPWRGALVHVLIDLCVVAAIWLRVGNWLKPLQAGSVQSPALP